MSGTWADLYELPFAAVQQLLARPERKVAIIPVGSVEAHGPHLPLGTDTFISVEVALRSARELASQGYIAVRFPPLHYSVTDWAAAFAGTVSIGSATSEGLVVETAKAARAMGFDRVVLTNAHLEPGHIATLRAAAARFAAETGSELVFPDKTRRKAAQRLTEEFQSGSCHAGQYETSLVLAIRPELVDLDRARALPAHVVPLHERIAAGARDFAECGLDDAYCGDPAHATAEEGEQTLTVLTALVVEAVEASFADAS
ncbi:MAG: creatininase family protein [Deltaproteobacteria bacterium]|nr:creatininase family protein [Nannocystaceae bacterium]